MSLQYLPNKKDFVFVLIEMYGNLLKFTHSIQRKETEVFFITRPKVELGSFVKFEACFCREFELAECSDYIRSAEHVFNIYK